MLSSRLDDHPSPESAEAVRWLSGKAFSVMRSARLNARGQDGFTLVELLITVIIIGILAAIAFPAFLSRRAVASDATAKQMANTAESAATVYGLDNPGYAGIGPAALKGVEASINVLTNGQTVLAAASATLTGYTLAVVSSAGNTFNIVSANGVLSRTCTIAAGNTGGGCRNGTW